ncbi:MAG: hypothetical protein ACF8GE_01900 [Phycisphaerales bacterium JB043]
MLTRKNTRVGATLLGVIAALAVTGCSKFYRVTDTRYGDVYYTENIDGTLADENGMISFVDAETGSRIRLYDYRVEMLKRQDFNWEVSEQRHMAFVRDEMD